MLILFLNRNEIFIMGVLQRYSYMRLKSFTKKKNNKCFFEWFKHFVIMKFNYFLQLCEPVKKLTKCRYFRDITWTLTSAGNSTKQVVHCHCPKGSIAYLLKRQPFQTVQGNLGYHYSFACSPQSVSWTDLIFRISFELIY